MKRETESNLISLTEVQALSSDALQNLALGTVIDCGDDLIIQKTKRWGGRDEVCWIAGKRGTFGFSLNGEPRSQTKNYGEFPTFSEALRILQANRNIIGDKIRQSLHQEEVDDDDSWE